MNWLAKLAENLERFTDPAVKEKVMAGREQIGPRSSALEKARWIIGAMRRLDELADKETRKRILAGCSHKFPKGRIRLVKKKYKESGSIDALLQIMSKDSSWGGLSYYEYPTREGNVLYVTKIPFNPKGYDKAENSTEKRYSYCHCHLVKELIRQSDEKISPTFCCCGAGWYHSLWEGILGTPVKVDVLKSVLQGDDCCKFAIHIPPSCISDRPKNGGNRQKLKKQTTR
jgi:hypothetical protein